MRTNKTNTQYSVKERIAKGRKRASSSGSGFRHLLLIKRRSEWHLVFLLLVLRTKEASCGKFLESFDTSSEVPLPPEGDSDKCFLH